MFMRIVESFVGIYQKMSLSSFLGDSSEYLGYLKE